MNEKTPTIHFRLNTRSDVALYRQLVEQVRQAVLSGQLRGGDQLPSVREVVTQITINPNTVHRAYRELEHLGVAEGRLGLGTFITENPALPVIETGHDGLTQDLRRWVQRAQSAGMDVDEMQDLLRRIIDLVVKVNS